MKESRLQKKIIDALRQQGCYVFKVVGSPMQQRGTPDILACKNGIFIGIEVKVPGEKLSKLQESEMQKIEKAGGIAIVATSLEDLRQISPYE